jgi:uncharacterized LabA/DUF88 family protein
LISGGIDAASDENGWAQLGPVGSYINKMSNDFDPRMYGFDKLSELITAIGLFEIERKDNKVFIRDKKKRPTANSG